MKKILLMLILFCVNIPLKSQTLYFVGSGTWTGSVWSTTNSAPYTTAWVSGRAAEFNAPNSVVTYASTNVSSITANEDVTITSAGTFGTGGLKIPLTVASGKTFDFGSQNISTAAGSGFIKNGLGVMVIQTTSNIYPGGVTLNDGTIICKGINSLGNGLLIINGGILAGNGSRDFSGKTSSITIGGNFTFGATTGLASSTADITFDAPIALGGSTRIISLAGTGINTLSGIISGTGGIETGTGSTGTLTLSGANIYSGGTTLSGGTLTLGASGVIPDASPVTMNGGTLKTGAFSETYSTLNLSQNSTINLANYVQSHTFTASNSIAWTASKTLTITGWTGGYNSTSGTAGKIFFGSNATGLTAQQLSQIKFFNGSINYDATILSTGEVAPNTITVLPIALTAFTGKSINKSILLNWNTASETNNNYYDVLRSADGKSFTSIGTVKGAGTSTNSKDYLFSDENPYAGTNYYQLVQHDFDGKTASSAIIPVDSKIDAATLSVYANVSSVKISLSSPNKTKGLLQVFDITGRKLSESSVEVNKGFNSFDLPLTLINGVHFARYTSSTETIHQKFIK